MPQADHKGRDRVSQANRLPRSLHRMPKTVLKTNQKRRDPEPRRRMPKLVDSVPKMRHQIPQKGQRLTQLHLVTETKPDEIIIKSYDTSDKL